MNEHYMEMGEGNPARQTIGERLAKGPAAPPNTDDIERVMREEETETVIQGTTHQDQIRADAINSVLRAKGIENLLTAYEAAKVFTILSHLEELAGYSG